MTTLNRFGVSAVSLTPVMAEENRDDRGAETDRIIDPLFSPNDNADRRDPEAIIDPLFKPEDRDKKSIVEPIFKPAEDRSIVEPIFTPSEEESGSQR